MIGLGSSAVEIPYNNFTTASGTGADFTNAGAITLLIDGSNSTQQAWNLEILSLSTAEPPGATAVTLSNFSATARSESGMAAGAVMALASVAFGAVGLVALVRRRR